MLALPFADHSLAFVLSNGVLHHTTDPEQGLAEIYRTLASGGACWIYLAGKIGFVARLIELMREVLRPVPREVTEHFMRLLGFSTQRRFFFLDTWYSPILVRYDSADVERLLAAQGFTKWRRLVRDVRRPHYTEINEVVYQQAPYAAFWYGEGDQRYLAEK